MNKNIKHSNNMKRKTFIQKLICGVFIAPLVARGINSSVILGPEADMPGIKMSGIGKLNGKILMVEQVSPPEDTPLDWSMIEIEVKPEGNSRQWIHDNMSGKIQIEIKFNDAGAINSQGYLVDSLTRSDNRVLTIKIT